MNRPIRETTFPPCTPKICVTDYSRSAEQQLFGSEFIPHNPFDSRSLAHTPPLRVSETSHWHPPGFSHLAMAALAAVQGSATDELIMVNEQRPRKSWFAPIFSNSTPSRKSERATTTKTLFWDLKLTSGLHVIGEDCLCFKRSSMPTYRKVQTKGLRNGLDRKNSLFGSCGMLPAPSSCNNSRRVAKQRMSFPGVSHPHTADIQSTPLVTSTPSPPGSPSHSSFASITFDLPSSSSSSPSLSTSHAHSAIHADLLNTHSPVVRGHNRVHSSTCIGPSSIEKPQRDEHPTTGALLPRLFRYNRWKTRWAVLIALSDSLPDIPNNLHNLAFLVLFKRKQKRSKLSVPTRSENVPTVSRLKQRMSHDFHMSPSSTVDSPIDTNLFSACHYKVLRVQAACIDHDASITPSVLIVDVSMNKKKVYRLTRFSDAKVFRRLTKTQYSFASPARLSMDLKPMSESRHGLRSMWRPFSKSKPKRRRSPTTSQLDSHTTHTEQNVAASCPCEERVSQIWSPLLSLFNNLR